MPVVPHIHGTPWALPGSYLASAAMISGSRFFQFFSFDLDRAAANMIGLELAHEEGRGRRHDDVVARLAGACSLASRISLES
jgi:hypothetical protein